jgi:thiol-disulfide isomerase/thioredoxin
MRQQGMGVVAVQPNHPDAVRLDELDYSKYGDSFDEMKIYAAEEHFSFPYVYDGETQATAIAYGALATPDLFLFDEQRKLRYSGRFDDSRFADPKTVKSNDAINAMNDLLSGKPVTVSTTRPMGCSVKWLSKAKKAGAAKDTAWHHEPVTLEPIDSAGVAALVRNETQKLRLINVWATWCVPCVEELPDLARLSYRLARRNFEVITISVDNPKEQAKALKLLQDKHVGMSPGVKDSLKAEKRATNNYLYTEASIDELARSLDPQWPGPVPYTILIAPGGQVVWRHNGALDPAVTVRTVMDQLGVYYSDK